MIPCSAKKVIDIKKVVYTIAGYLGIFKTACGNYAFQEELM
jgi:hypothetical protein